MAEEEEKLMLNKIEKLILDGNKEVLGRLDKLEDGQNEVLGRLDKLEDGQNEVLGRLDKLEDGQRTLEKGQQQLDQKAERISKTFDATAQASYGLLTDVQKDIKEVKGRLNEHMCQPAHA